MNIRQDVNLRSYTTMRLGGNARYLVEVETRQELGQAVMWAKGQSLAIIVIGGGSNTFWRDEGFDGLVIVNKILHYEDFKEDESNHYVTVGAGENWDSVVQRTVETGLTGIECLSLIPGSAGGTPVQNVGAYGQEIASTLTTVEAYDNQTDQFLTLPGSDCGFSYRTSRFKTSDKGRYFITALTLHLIAGNPAPPFYGALQEYLDTNNIAEYTPSSIRNAVIAIRSSKLPDPAEIANNGSFFANPVVDEYVFAQLSDAFDGNVPRWDAGEGQYKLSAAWLIDQAGFKAYYDPETGMGTWPKQSLVLVNENAESTAQLLKFRDKIIDTVKQKYNIDLLQEPELLP